MGVSSGEVFEFSADAKQAIAEYAKLQASIRATQGELTKAARAAVSGSVEAQGALDAHSSKILILNKQFEETRKRINEAKAAQQGLSQIQVPGTEGVSGDLSAAIAAQARLQAALQATQNDLMKASHLAEAGNEAAAKETLKHAAAVAVLEKRLEAAGKDVARANGAGKGFLKFSGQAGANVTQLSFAVDDFLTVWSGQGGKMGMVNGMRAAANNMSFVLASFNPLLAIVPSLAGAVLSLGVRLQETADASKAAVDGNREYLSSIEHIEDALKGMAEGERAAADARDERQFLGKMSVLTEAAQKARQEVVDAQHAYNEYIRTSITRKDLFEKWTPEEQREFVARSPAGSIVTKNLDEAMRQSDRADLEKSQLQQRRDEFVAAREASRKKQEDDRKATETRRFLESPLRDVFRDQRARGFQGQAVEQALLDASGQIAPGNMFRKDVTLDLLNQFRADEKAGVAIEAATATPERANLEMINSKVDELSRQLAKARFAATAPGSEQGERMSPAEKKMIELAERQLRETELQRQDAKAVERSLSKKMPTLRRHVQL
ncbi:hypothetical protein Pan216_20870 [Planctomycetes bacterium Pan216]|uniref:Uncharacterized protein n=1 Tax=Kolteria novifilia TaxID=2527975 RepID=A0A518B2L5_9BACT|nr:hypothetical protein Pan216_20870 [Planctomycetes bacterium Pan216]